MKQSPTIWNLKQLINTVDEITVKIDKSWIPARPIGAFGINNRFKAAWLVFTGKADAVIWPGNQ